MFFVCVITASRYEQFILHVRWRQNYAHCIFFEWLFASALGHTKYKIWLFRIISYVGGLLSKKQAYEYKWNMTVNLVGGTGHNIPNNNCVEIQVHNIKSQLQSQGSNKSFEYAKNLSLTNQVIEDIKEQLMKTTHSYKTKRFRPPVDNTKDIQLIVECLRKKWTN